MERDTYNERREQVIMKCGGAAIIRNLCGGYELRGGNVKDRREVLTWADRFLPESVKTDGQSYKHPLPKPGKTFGESRGIQ